MHRRGGGLNRLAEMPAEMRQLVRAELVDPTLAASMLLAAHLIIFWLSQDSNVTPPVCLVAFTAAAIAGTRPMRTGLTSWKIAKGLYLVPLLFAFSPLITGDWQARLTVFVFACLGLYALAGLLQWHAVEERELRHPWILDLHWAAVIRDTSTDQRYAVDSWFLDNGQPPYIQPLDQWLSGRAFNHGQEQLSDQ